MTYFIHLFQVTNVYSYANLRVRLLGWEGDGDDGNGKCCEPLCIGGCDPYFKLCVTSNKYAFLTLIINGGGSRISQKGVLSYYLA